MDIKVFSLWAVFAISLLTVLLIVMVPVSRFYDYGWKVRKEEFTNRLAGKSIQVYLDRCWASTILRENWVGMKESQQFERVYDVLSGQKIYILPMILLSVCIILFGELAIQGAIRMGYEWYIQTYMATKTAEPTVFIQGIDRLTLRRLDSAFWPFPPLLLTLAALAAVAGAYLAVVQTVIYGYKTRTLLSSDLLWASFRLVIAIPLGYSIGEVAAAPLGALVSFGLGAFPISAVSKLLRRLTSRSLSDSEEKDHDDLLKMSGVTPDVSARLNEEGVFSPQQLANADPVSLAIRAGLSFDFVLNLVAQSQVWCFVGVTASTMTPLGCGDARVIRRFFGPGAPAAPVALAAGVVWPPMLGALAQATTIEAEALRQVLTLIANDPFTQFLTDLEVMPHVNVAKAAAPPPPVVAQPFHPQAKGSRGFFSRGLFKRDDAR